MNQLKSGNTYSLQELFSGNRKIIIPDMQRDYTWGDDDRKETLVKNFCQNLLDLSSSEKSIAIGMIYAYPNPENHYHLIDGQQRITTLFLLMGMLHKHTELKELKERLIYTFELEDDDQEPYLQYAIRESSLYFLSDLVVNFFLDGNSKKEVSSIRSEPWYFSEYDHDPSINSMLGALDVIEEIIKNKDDLKGFSTWLIEKVTFFYFDMENREHGEEMFVVINTTGEPLEVTEELKPLLIGDIPCEQKREELSAQWEERETFFWKNRKQPTEHTADEGMMGFLTWYVRIKNKTESVDLKKYFKESSKVGELEEIHSFFISFQKTLEFFDKNYDLKRLFSEDDKGNYTFALSRVRGLSARLNNMFLPFWYFNHKFGNAEFPIKEKFLRRLRKNQFYLKWKRDGYVGWHYILQIIEKEESPNDALIFNKQFDKIEKTEIPKSTWYTKEEWIKDKLRNKNPENDTMLKEWEDHPDFMGDLSILLQAYLLKENNNNNIPELNDNEEYDFAELSRIMENYRAVIDPLRTGEVNDNALSNIFRLFRIYAGINNIGHIYQTNWGIRGVYFSDNNRNHLKEKDFLHVIKAEKPYDFCKNYIVHPDRINYDSFKSEKFFHQEGKWFMTEYFIKIWLTLKVFAAIKNEDLLDRNDYEAGVSAYTDSVKNKIFNNKNHTGFSLENSICGYAKRRKHEILYSTQEDWCKTHSIYTPFADVPFITGEINRKPVDGDIGLLAANKKAIDEVIEFIFQ